MLTTSRREITVDNIENESKERLSFNDSTLAREGYDFSGGSSFEEPSFFSNTDIASKLFGDETAAAQTTADATEEDFSNPDLMPSFETLKQNKEIDLSKYFSREYNTVPRTSTKTNAKLSAKEKIVIVSYIAVVLVLVLTISLTAVALSNVMGEVAALQAGVESQLAELKALNSEINNMYTDEEIKNIAGSQLGLEEASEANTMYYEPLPMRPSANYDVPSNWFNNFCEWLSNIFGG